MKTINLSEIQKEKEKIFNLIKTTYPEYETDKFNKTQGIYAFSKIEKKLIMKIPVTVFSVEFEDYSLDLKVFVYPDNLSEDYYSVLIEGLMRILEGIEITYRNKILLVVDGE